MSGVGIDEEDFNPSKAEMPAPRKDEEEDKWSEEEGLERAWGEAAGALFLEDGAEQPMRESVSRMEVRVQGEASGRKRCCRESVRGTRSRERGSE
ncbi:unnamed protein product [Arctogadus glacialis]